MTVAFDGICLADGPITGVARAFLTGLAAYLAIAPEPPVLLLPTGTPLPQLPGFVRAVAAPRGRLRRQWTLPRLLHRHRCTLLHSPVAAVPLRASCPTIATVHDLPWTCPESGERGHPWRRLATRQALRAAAAVLAPSQFTLAAARTIAPDAHLHLVPHATPAPTAPPTERTGPLLVLGDDRPRKNRQRVVAAWQQARARAHDLPELHFCGPPDAYVDEAQKSALLRRCRALVQMSRFEGFGLPVLEGLAHAAPVVCADIPPFREVAADCALFVDPLDVDAIADALVRIAADAPLRARLQRQGPERAAAFMPDTVAAVWLRLHRELAR